MNLQSIPVLMMSAVCLYVSCYYFIMYFLRRHEREYLTFALSCLSVFVYDLTCAGLYNAVDLESGIFWQRGNFVSSSLIAVSIIWFISDFTKTRAGLRVAVLTVYYFAMIPVTIFVNNELVLTSANPSIKNMEIGSFLSFTYFEAEPGILCIIQLLVTLVAFLYLIFMLIVFRIRKKEHKSVKIIVSFCIFFAGVFSDSLVSSGVYNFIYLSEYTFMYIILIMGYELQVNFVRIQNEAENLNVNLEHIVSERTIELIEKQKKIEEEKNVMSEWRREMDIELDMARCIQQQIIPDDNPARHISALFKPMAPIGGDFYDFIRFREADSIGIFISDVSGHGVPAALITTMIKSLISEAGGSKLNPAQMLMNLNRTLVKQSGKNFVTAFYGIYNSTERSLTYSCAGHNAPLLVSGNSIIQMNKARSIPLGILTRYELEEMNKSFVNQKEILPAGSKLLLYTDGLTETRGGAGGERYFETILEETLISIADLSCTDLVKTLYSTLVEFRGSENFEDDVSIICVSVE